MSFRTLRMAPVVAALAAVALVGCDDGTGIRGGDATVRVLLTDAPADYIEAAWVDIGAVQLVPVGEEGEFGGPGMGGEGQGGPGMGGPGGTGGQAGHGGIITLTEDGTDGMINLLDLQNAATAELASLEIEAGTYTQLRLIVEAAEVELKEGYTFRDGSTTMELFVPSGAQTGIKLNLGAGDGEMRHENGVDIRPGETVLVLDFDVNQSFRVRGNFDSPAGAHGIIFKPTLRVTVQDVAGSIAGVVDAPDSVSVEGLVVEAVPLDEGTLEAYQTTTATASTAADGSFTLHFMVPGSYTVSVTAPEGFEMDPAGIDVTVDQDEDVSGLEFHIVEPSTDDSSGGSDG